MDSRKMLLFGLFILLALAMAGCAGAAGEPGPAGAVGPAGPQGPAGPAPSAAELTCMECHDDTTLIAGKAAAWAESVHGTGTSYLRGTSAGCAGCHSGGAFSAMAAVGLNPSEVEAGDPDPTRQDCRACHEIHTTYTGDDWALETTDPVALFAFEGVTFDGGEGNLCANCHQPRRGIGEVTDGMIEIDSSHWGPHHGPQSSMLLGLGGSGAEGSPSAHATMVEDTCVSCHVGEGADHSFEPNVAACTGCHADIEDFDLNGLQTEVEALIAELGEKLETAGLLEDGDPVPGTYPEAQAQAAWNWIYITLEDKSMGVHNPAYTKALLEAGLAVFE